MGGGGRGIRKIIKGNSEAEFKITSFTVCAVLSRSVVSDSLRPHGLQPARILCPWRFSRQEYWNGFPCPPPGDLPNLGIKPGYPALQVDSLPTEPPWKLHSRDINSHKLMCRIYTILSNFTWCVCVNQ